MKLLLTSYASDAWRLFVKEVGLPSTSELSLMQDGQALLPIQPLPNLEKFMVNSSADLHMHLAVIPAEYFIAEQLEKGKNFLTAVNEWQDSTNKILDFHRQYRSQVTLFNLQEALTHPDLFRKAFNYSGTAKLGALAKSPDALPLLAASFWINNHSQLHSLNLRLLASSVPLSKTDSLPLNLESVIDEYKKTKLEYVETQQELVFSKKETELILSQLHQTQEQLEDYYLQLISAEEKNKEMVKNLTIDFENKINQELIKNEVLNENLTRYNEQFQRLTARAESAEYMLDLLNKELARYKSSLVWKLTTPLRVLGRLIKKESRSRQKIQKDVGLILATNYFDEAWYLTQYPDVAESKMNPAEHYLLYGADEGRLPGLLFDGNWYKQQYPDVVDAGINPLLHFLIYGLKEGRSCRPLTRKQDE